MLLQNFKEKSKSHFAFNIHSLVALILYNVNEVLTFIILLLPEKYLLFNTFCKAGKLTTCSFKLSVWSKFLFSFTFEGLFHSVQKTRWSALAPFITLENVTLLSSCWNDFCEVRWNSFFPSLQMRSPHFGFFDYLWFHYDMLVYWDFFLIVFFLLLDI